MPFYKFKSQRRAATFAYTPDRSGDDLPEVDQWETQGKAGRGEVSRKMQADIKKQGYAVKVVLVTNVNTPVPPALARKLRSALQKRSKARKRK